MLDNLNPNTLSFYSNKMSKTIERITETLNDLLDFIDATFEQLRDAGELNNLLPIVDFTLKREFASTPASTAHDLGSERLLLLLEKHIDHESDQRIVVQIFYQLLHSLSEQDTKNVQISLKFLNALCRLMIDCKQEQLAANIAYCLQLYCKKCEVTALLQLLWPQLLTLKTQTNRQQRLARILVLLIDELLHDKDNFYENKDLIEIVQQLLQSDERVQRKSAIYVMQNVIPVIIENAKASPSWQPDYSDDIKSSWSSYMAVLQNLEEKQSHLILPTLTTIKRIKLPNVWLELLYTQLLKHNNVLVQRWTIEYFLDNFKCAQLGAQQLRQLLLAANNTNLYNYDNYCIDATKLKDFLNCDLMQFFIVFADINWKSVPLHFWLQNICIPVNKPSMLNSNTLMQIAARVRALQNKIIRAETIMEFSNTFDQHISRFNISDFGRYVENLYNASDAYSMNVYNSLRLDKHLDSINNIQFTQHFYEILYNINYSDKVQNKFFSIYENFPAEDHGWFRFMAVFDLISNERQIEFCRKNYDIDLSAAIGNNLHDFSAELIKKLLCQKSEKSFVHEKTVDCYVKRKFVSFNELLVKDETVDELLDMGSFQTMHQIAQLICNSRKFMDADNILKSFLKCLTKHRKYSYHCYSTAKYLLEYCKRNLSATQSAQFAVELFNLDDNQLTYAIVKKNMPTSNIEQFIDRYLQHEASNGDSRVEERYIVNNDFYIQPWNQIDYISYIVSQTIDDLDTIMTLLLKKNADVSLKKPRYFENSHEHRIKIRIALIIANLFKETKVGYWNDEFWQVILKHGNQLNITCMYERIVAYCAPNMANVLKYLNEINKYTSSHQVSIIVICYAKCMLNWESITDVEKKYLIEQLLPLTMGANYQTRLYAQLAIYKLLIRAKESGSTKDAILIAYFILIKTIESTLGTEHLRDLLHDIRLDIDCETIWNFENILFVTNAPFDEYSEITESEQNKYGAYKEQFAKKRNVISLKNDTVKMENIEIVDVQRKMNPSTDIMPANDLVVHPEFQEKQEMESNVIVVASLIDKMPNLGGIARTCEVLGIKNLVMSSKKFTLNSDFKNLSMTAENGLNISEVSTSNLLQFLIDKQIEGYQIVGAEQTARSESFVNFQFPKKCIILLGHEKEGIPANLISLLDHTVEIPQFGLVRSLNVHVTGALFMWEYCKQHIAE